MSKKQTFVVQGKMGDKYKIANKTDLSVQLLEYHELKEFMNDKFNIVELDDYMNNIYYDDVVYGLFE